MRSVLLALALFAWGSSELAHAAEEAAPPRIYRWIDQNGIAHYTTDPERIPRDLRRRHGLPAAPLRNEPLDAHAPRPAAGQGPDAWAAQEKAAPEAPRAPLAGEASDTAGEWRDGGEGDSAALAPAASAERLAQIELRIADLSAAIAADEDALSARIADPAAADAITLGDEPAFREIALRLPKRIQELEALQDERDALQSAVH